MIAAIAETADAGNAGVDVAGPGASADVRLTTRTCTAIEPAGIPTATGGTAEQDNLGPNAKRKDHGLMLIQ